MKILLSFVIGIGCCLPAFAKDEAQPDVDIGTLFHKLDKNDDKQLSLSEFESMSKFLRVVAVKKNAELGKDQPTPDKSKVKGDQPKKPDTTKDELKNKSQPDQAKPDQDKPKGKPDQVKGDKEEPKKKPQPDQPKTKENPDQDKPKAKPDQSKGDKEEHKKKPQQDQGKVKENPDQDKSKAKLEGKGDKEEPKKKVQQDQGKGKANPDEGKPKSEEKTKAKE